MFFASLQSFFSPLALDKVNGEQRSQEQSRN
jgi:hypothetical protein